MADRLVVRTERRRRPIRVGFTLAAIGLLLVIVGGVASWIAGIGQAALAYDRAEVGEALAFDGKSGDYSVLLLNSPVEQATNNDLPEAELACTGERPDGSSFELDGARQAVSSETEAGVEIGRFSTGTGSTSVTCDWKTPRDVFGYYYSVAPAPSWFAIGSTAVFIAGFVAIAAAVVLLIVGYRGRAVTVREAVE